MPPVSPFGMNPCVTGFAQGNQVVPGMGAAFRQRFLMVNFFRHHIPVMLQTQFAKRMAGYVSISDLLPGPAVPFLRTGTPLILFVPLVHDLLVLLTVPTVRQVRAAWEGTGAFGFSRHSCHLLSGMKKALQIALQGYPTIVFSQGLTYNKIRTTMGRSAPHESGLRRYRKKSK